MKKVIVLAIIAVVGFIAFDWITGFTDNDEKVDNVVFHITLANPELYTNGIHTDEFSIEPGTYFFRFVPNGSSPEILSIKLTSQNYEFLENYTLIGTPHESETAKYFTWKYQGKGEIIIESSKQISININPNGNVNGSVSVDLIKKEA